MTGVVLTKMDGDARGGAALSIRQVTGQPIKFIGVGEKYDALEPFHPDRIVSRILGMGDILSLIEKAESQIDKKKAEEMATKALTGDGFSLEDFRDQLRQVRKMGSLQSLMGMLPSIGPFAGLQKHADKVDEGQINRVEAIINSMTSHERNHHEVHQRQPPQTHCPRLRNYRAGSEQPAASVRANAKDVQADGQAQLREATGRDEVPRDVVVCYRWSANELFGTQKNQACLAAWVRRRPATNDGLMKWRSLEESNSIDLRPLSEIFAERKALIEKYVPTEIRALHQRVVEQLQAQKIAEHALQVRATAPAFELKDHQGKTVSSADLLSHGRLVICFFRGRWDPFCCGQLEAMNQIVGQIQAADASMVAISPQIEQQAFFMADQHKLKFPLLSDTGNKVAKEFGLAYRVPDEQQEIYKRVFINLPRVNGDASWELPIPATYILERDGTVLYANANPDYTARPEPLNILAALEKH